MLRQNIDSRDPGYYQDFDEKSIAYLVTSPRCVIEAVLGQEHSCTRTCLGLRCSRYDGFIRVFLREWECLEDPHRHGEVASEGRGRRFLGRSSFGAKLDQSCLMGRVALLQIARSHELSAAAEPPPTRRDDAPAEACSGGAISLVLEVSGFSW